MSSKKEVVLVVDDEPLNLEILTEHLEEVGYEVAQAEDGVQAWALLEATPHRFSAVLLDRMMPNMDGMGVLALMKANPELDILPVILQTAKAAKAEILEGLEAGAYYYLTKPFDRATMLAIVKTAISDFNSHLDLKLEVSQTLQTISLLTQGEFAFRTLEEGRLIANHLAKIDPAAGRVVVGLSELLINAVEHGNLRIGYQEKTDLVNSGEWQSEIDRRLTLPEYAEKQVTLRFELSENELSFLIKDQGNGFDWENYLEISPDRIFDNHGRGIAMARAKSFDYLEYRDGGREVFTKINLNAAKS